MKSSSLATFNCRIQASMLTKEMAIVVDPMFFDRILSRQPCIFENSSTCSSRVNKIITWALMHDHSFSNSGPFNAPRKGWSLRNGLPHLLIWKDGLLIYRNNHPRKEARISGCKKLQYLNHLALLHALAFRWSLSRLSLVREETYSSEVEELV